MKICINLAGFYDLQTYLLLLHCCRRRRLLASLVFSVHAHPILPHPAGKKENAIHVCIYIHLITYICIYLYIYIYVCIYVHTHARLRQHKTRSNAKKSHFARVQKLHGNHTSDSAASESKNSAIVIN